MQDSDTGFAIGCGLVGAIVLVFAAGAFVYLRPAPTPVANGAPAPSATVAAPAAPIVPAGPMVPVAPEPPVAAPASVVLADDVVQRVVRTHGAALRRACFERAADHDAQLDITAVLDASGTVTSTTVMGTADATLTRCVEHAVGGWTFPAPGVADARAHFSIHLTR
jgi:hypothetical protein